MTKNSPLKINVRALTRTKRIKFFLFNELLNIFKNKLINDKYKNNCRHADEINPLLKIIKGKTENIRAPIETFFRQRNFDIICRIKKQ